MLILFSVEEMNANAFNQTRIATCHLYQGALLPIDIRQFCRNLYRFKRQSFDSNTNKWRKRQLSRLRVVMYVNLSVWRVGPQEIIINTSLFLRKWSQQDAAVIHAFEEEMKPMNIYTMNNISVGNFDLNITYMKI